MLNNGYTVTPPKINNMVHVSVHGIVGPFWPTVLRMLTTVSMSSKNNFSCSS